MKPVPDPIDAPVALAEDKLSRLGVQVEAMQALLVRLLQDVVQAEARLGQSQVTRLVEVNERLMVATMLSLDEADTAAQALDEAKQSGGLDALTRLPNRNALLERGRQALANARRRESRLAVLFMDLDNFKQLNDRHGHAFGDMVLCLAADQMRSVVREVDTISRHGGDEFIILLAELSQPADAQAVADKLAAVIGTPVVLDGRTVTITASIGIAVYPEDGTDIETLIARADAAMYDSKRQLAGGVAFHGSGVVANPDRPTGPRPTSSHPAHRNTSVIVDAEHRHAQLREANEKLVLAALNARELQEAAELAQQRQMALMSAVADELRNPMAPIRITSAMLGQLPAEELLLPRVKGIVEQQMTHLTQLVEHLVDASAADPPSLELEHRWVDLVAVIDAAIAAQRPQMEGRGQRFASHRPPGAIGVLGDAARLEQVFGNLLDNASKHTHEGGQIGLSVVVAGDTVTLTVSDNGIGITAQLLPYVFDPFVQDAHALGFNGIGLGIGLTVVRALVRAHGGEIVARSAGTRRGSQLIVTLPLAAGPRPAPEVLGATADNAGGPGAERQAA